MTSEPSARRSTDTSSTLPWMPTPKAKSTSSSIGSREEKTPSKVSTAASSAADRSVPLPWWMLSTAVSLRGPRPSEMLVLIATSSNVSCHYALSLRRTQLLKKYHVLNTVFCVHFSVVGCACVN